MMRRGHMLKMNNMNKILIVLFFCLIGCGSSRELVPVTSITSFGTYSADPQTGIITIQILPSIYSQNFTYFNGQIVDFTISRRAGQ